MQVDIIAFKMVFKRYPENSKRYMVYGEHLSGDMIEIDSHNVDVLEHEFPSVGEMKKDLDCISYSMTFNHHSVRGRI